MKKITVNVSNGYDIIIERNCLDNCAEMIKKVSSAEKVTIITDSNVKELYEERVKKSLSDAGYEVYTFTFEAGESSKKLSTVYEMLCFMAEKGMSRKDLVVALGGGVTGDMAGFAAASYQRGIEFVQIPTTLLSQIDSSVGGKTGVDLPQGKNLCGAFHQPSLVIIDPVVLGTLSERFFNDGMGEAIKYGCIKSKTLFDTIATKSTDEFLDDMIYQCVDIKRQVVENDEKEHGERALLNFGHTFGHAIEKYNKFENITHGEAVAIGMIFAAKMGEKAGLTEKGTADKIKLLAEKYSLPCSTNAPFNELIKAVNNDKKRSSNYINFIMLKSIGSSFIEKLPVEEMKKYKDLF